MISLLFVAFIIMTVGLFLAFKVSPVEMATDIFKKRTIKEKPLNDKIKALTSKKKKRGLKKLIDETKHVLIMTNKENLFMLIVILSLVFMTIGFFIAITINNMFLIPVLAIGFSLLPFWYVKFTAIKWKKGLNSELETALSVITTSYLRSESIITAIEENVNYINPPVQDVFLAFLTQTKLINANTKLALEGLKLKIESTVFHEWVDALIDCQEDKNLKSTLTPIVSKLSDMRMVSAELDYLLYEPIKEFVTMAILLVGNIPLMYMLNKDWYHTLMFTGVGKFVLAVCGIVIFVSLAAVVKLSKPVEYKR
jgi:Flp pilus assembly protein TadB